MSRASSAGSLRGAPTPSLARRRSLRSFSLPQYRSPGSRFQRLRRRPPSTAAAPHPPPSEVVNAYRPFSGGVSLRPRGDFSMSQSMWVPGALALACFASTVHAASDAELTEIRAQIKDLKETYEARIQALERRVKEAGAKAEGVVPPTQSSAGASAGAQAPADAAGAPSAPPAATASVAAAP